MVLAEEIASLSSTIQKLTDAVAEVVISRSSQEIFCATPCSDWNRFDKLCSVMSTHSTMEQIASFALTGKVILAYEIDSAMSFYDRLIKGLWEKKSSGCLYKLDGCGNYLYVEINENFEVESQKSLERLRSFSLAPQVFDEMPKSVVSPGGVLMSQLDDDDSKYDELHVSLINSKLDLGLISDDKGEQLGEGVFKQEDGCMYAEDEQILHTFQMFDKISKPNSCSNQAQLVRVPHKTVEVPVLLEASYNLLKLVVSTSNLEFQMRWNSLVCYEGEINWGKLNVGLARERQNNITTKLPYSQNIDSNHLAHYDRAKACLVQVHFRKESGKFSFYCSPVILTHLNSNPIDYNLGCDNKDHIYMDAFRIKSLYKSFDPGIGVTQLSHPTLEDKDDFRGVEDKLCTRYIPEQLNIVVTCHNYISGRTNTSVPSRACILYLGLLYIEDQLGILLEMECSDKNQDQARPLVPYADVQTQAIKLDPHIAKFISIGCSIGMMKQQMMEIGYNVEKLPLVELTHDSSELHNKNSHSWCAFVVTSGVLTSNLITLIFDPDPDLGGPKCHLSCDDQNVEIVRLWVFDPGGKFDSRGCICYGAYVIVVTVFIHQPERCFVRA